MIEEISVLVEDPTLRVAVTKPVPNTFFESEGNSEA
jgi:hypothetical protein